MPRRSPLAKAGCCRELRPGKPRSFAREASEGCRAEAPWRRRAVAASYGQASHAPSLAKRVKDAAPKPLGEGGLPPRATARQATLRRRRPLGLLRQQPGKVARQLTGGGLFLG